MNTTRKIDGVKKLEIGTYTWEKDCIEDDKCNGMMK